MLFIQIGGEIMRIKSRSGHFIKIDCSKGKFGLVPGDVVQISHMGCHATVVGTGGWPNEYGLEKLWVKEDNGDYSYIESPKDFKQLIYV
jgi:hypothetical protein